MAPEGEIKMARGTKRRFVSVNVPSPQSRRFYNFNGGIDTLTANEALPAGVSPFLRNKRYKSRETIITRKGPGYYSDAIDQALNDVETGATTGNRTVSTSLRQATKFTSTLAQCLVRVDLYLKSTLPAGTGPVIVEIYTDNSGQPGTKIASSSIASGAITSSYAYLPARFINAPLLSAATNYWIVAYVQAGGTNSYLWGSAAGSDSATGNGSTYTAAAYSLNFKTYLAPNNPILGGIRWYKSDGTKKTVIANKKGVYTVNDVTGAVTQIYAGNNSATQYVFEPADDKLFFVNGYDAPQYYDGTTVAAAGGSPPISIYVKLHKNRLFYLSAADKGRVVFTEAGDFTTILSVNFLYVPTPKTPDPVQLMLSLQDNLIFRTRGTRWVLYGSDLASFVLRRSTGLAGVVAPFASVAHDNFEYSVADNSIYSFNGATDMIIGESVQPDFDAIVNKEKMAAVISGNLLRIFYPLAGQTQNTQAFVYDMKFNIYFIDDNAYFSCGFVMRGNGDAETLILGSSMVGCVYYADTAYSDLGAPITDRYWTKYDSFGTPEQQKIMRRFFPKFIGQQSSYTCDIYVDFDFRNAPSLVSSVNMQASGPVWGTMVWGAFTWGKTGNIEPELEVEGEFKSRQYRFEHTGVDQPVELYGLTDYFFPQRSL